MGFVARSRRKMWFGTEEYATWIPTPNSGADSSPQAWNESGTFLGGDGYAIGSRNSHKQYVYEWPSSSSREDAQLMKSFYEGTYGRGKLYFVEPLIYDTNVLPAKWANPSITAGFEGPSIVPGINPTTSSVPVNSTLNPVTVATYDLSETPSRPDTLDDLNSVFIPIPEDMDLLLGGSFTGTGSVQVATRTSAGYSSTSVSLTSSPTGVFSLPTRVSGGSGVQGVRLWVGGSGSFGGGTISINYLAARLVPSGGLMTGPDHWIGGQGHAGTRFALPPTYISNTGVGGGQISYAATFKESLI